MAIKDVVVVHSRCRVRSMAARLSCAQSCWPPADCS